MKILKNNFVKLLTLVLLVTSCTDFIEPVLPYKDFEFGVYLRTVGTTSTSFDSQNWPGSRFAITVEAVDPELGKTVQSVEIRVRHRRLVSGTNVYIPAAGANNEVIDVFIKTLTDADFKPNNQSRFLRADIQITALEILTALGVSENQINVGDNFEVRLKLTDKSGRTFTNVNASLDVRGGAFYASPFLYNIPVN